MDWQDFVRITLAAAVTILIVKLFALIGYQAWRILG